MGSQVCVWWYGAARVLLLAGTRRSNSIVRFCLLLFPSGSFVRILVASLYILAYLASNIILLIFVRSAEAQKPHDWTLSPRAYEHCTVPAEVRTKLLDTENNRRQKSEVHNRR